MNAPDFALHSVEAPAPVAEALQRFATLAEAAGRDPWVPPPVEIDEAAFARMVDHLALSPGEQSCIAFLAAVECNAAVARQVAEVQAPLAGARPLAGLLSALFAAEGVTVASLRSGVASSAGLIAWGTESAPLPERSVGLHDWQVAALSGASVLPAGVTEPALPEVRLVATTRTSARAMAATIANVSNPAVIIRAGCAAEGLAMAGEVARAAGQQLVMVEDASAPGIDAWLATTGHWAVTRRDAAPGDTIDLQPFNAIEAPLFVLTNDHGRVETIRTVIDWPAPMPNAAARAELWAAWGLSPSVAEAAAERYRQSSGRIADIGRQLTAFVEPDLATLQKLMLAGGSRIDALARRSVAEVQRRDIVVPEALGASLDQLRDRIRLRNRLADNLGPTLAARYRPGVRALLAGDSGTGKTLAAHWLANEAGLPLYRVDLASMVSKWIGETEKNLSQLLDAAEQGDVMLFFDEADSLFGARTDVSDANDRHANAQTNFLLQRIEDYAGVCLLATNNRDRFDPAFVRRLDMVLEFPLPDAPARRALWDRHLGMQPQLNDRDLDRLASAVELSGGHVRNIALSAASRAMAQARAISIDDLLSAATEEYAKLGRTPPVP